MQFGHFSFKTRVRFEKEGGFAPLPGCATASNHDKYFIATQLSANMKPPSGKTKFYPSLWHVAAGIILMRLVEQNEVSFMRYLDGCLLRETQCSGLGACCGFRTDISGLYAINFNRSGTIVAHD